MVIWYLNEEYLTLEKWTRFYPEKYIFNNESIIDKDVIYEAIGTSEKLKIEENNDFEGFSIITVDTKVSIITFEKEDDDYIFLVDIRDKDEFKYKTKIRVVSDLNKAVDIAIDMLNSHPVFNQYTDDIELLKQ